MSNRKARFIDQSGPVEALRPILVSVLVGTLCCVALLLLLSFIMSAQNIPQRAVGPMATFAVTFGALAAGFCCGKIQRRSGLAYGALCGGVLCLIVMLASIPFGDDGFGMLALFKIIFMLLSGMLGGVMGVNTRQKRRK